MIDLTKGKTKEETMHLAGTLLSMIKEDGLGEEAQGELEGAAALQNISKLLACVKYAVLV